MYQDIDDAYAELGLAPGASEAEVKAAWRRLVSRWHPDRNPGAAALARMQRINRSFEAIRARGFVAAADAEPASPPPAAEPEASNARADTAEAAARVFSRKVRLTLAEAAFGCTRVLRGKPAGDCTGCAGVGHHMTGGHCAHCQGSGAVRQGAWFGWMGASVECEACHGSGRAQQVCAACGGSGRSSTPAYRVTVRFPPGVRDGDLLSVRTPAAAGAGQPIELALRIEVPAHPQLLLDADGTLRCTMPVDGFAWLGNRTVEVPTLEGLQPLALQRGRFEHRLPGLGFPVGRRGPRGDLCVSVQPLFPEPLSTDQQILVDQLVATRSGGSGQQTPAALQAWRQALQASARVRRRPG